jgi:hypothetical protein
MTFKGQYLTYKEYKDLVESEGGSAMAEMPFNLLEFEARRQIDIRTLNRLKNSENIPQEVKLCDYALINSINGFANANDSIVNNGNVKNENTDGYSVNYISAGEISEVVKSKNDEIQDIITTYLLGIIFNGEHLLYCGV